MSVLSTPLRLLAGLLIAAACLPAAVRAEPTPEAADSVYRAGDWDASVKAYRALVAAEPASPRNWYRFGRSLHATRRYAEAVPAMRRAEGLGVPASLTEYNVACSFALMGEPDSAFAALRQAVDAGFSQDRTLAGDEDLASLRGDPRYAPLEEEVKRKAHPCEYDDDYRRFDFWIGDWNVLMNGQQVGTNTIQRLLDGCALLENWTSARGVEGKSLNTYDPQVGKWRQHWVSANGTVSEYLEVETPPGANIRFLAKQHENGKDLLRRMTFTRVAEDTVRQFIEDSEDDGTTWKVSFDGTYVRK